ncbi:hypothetical protein H2200_003522 [Cladophialophora chaetospira]|uniref:Uncharacterized protein n=1 Tax=Cladophialophora chaetospira TaxID=386627 RepID=A0AA39CMD3_9EURO|nr:hypothetical protein H2200_003522 [Cladophialophora chaetospira]
MQLPKSILALTLAFFISPIYAQASGAITCFGGSPANVLASDWTNLASDFQDLINQGEVSDLLAETSSKLSSQLVKVEGTARLEVDNFFLFATTHLVLANLVEAIQEVQAQCCGDFSMCIGGGGKILGDDGLSLDFIITNPANANLIGETE